MIHSRLASLERLDRCNKTTYSLSVRAGSYTMLAQTKVTFEDSQISIGACRVPIKGLFWAPYRCTLPRQTSLSETRCRTHLPGGHVLPALRIGRRHLDQLAAPRSPGGLSNRGAAFVRGAALVEISEQCFRPCLDNLCTSEKNISPK